MANQTLPVKLMFFTHQGLIGQTVTSLPPELHLSGMTPLAALPTSHGGEDLPTGRAGVPGLEDLATVGVALLAYPIDNLLHGRIFGQRGLQGNETVAITAGLLFIRVGPERIDLLINLRPFPLQLLEKAVRLKLPGCILVLQPFQLPGDPVQCGHLVTNLGLSAGPPLVALVPFDGHYSQKTSPVPNLTDQRIAHLQGF